MTDIGEQVDTLNSNIEQFQAQDTEIDESITALQTKDVELESRENELEESENNIDMLWGYLRLKR